VGPVVKQNPAVPRDKARSKSVTDALNCGACISLTVDRAEVHGVATHRVALKHPRRILDAGSRVNYRQQLCNGNFCECRIGNVGISISECGVLHSDECLDELR
jgi:hypothetical protein